MSVFVDRDSKVIIQGFTGQHATFHAEESMSFGTKVVGGVPPGSPRTPCWRRPRPAWAWR
jgi:succinyl-CoA synthetase alpha subunit